MLFVPFLELKVKQSLEDVKDHNIGMGLACSKTITKSLMGDIKINHSRKGFTSFKFKIPVTVRCLLPMNSLMSPSKRVA